jgi:predicted nuclease with TOPRIM domain
MNRLDTISHNTGEEKEQGRPSQSTPFRANVAGYDDRLTELEVENSRLNRLVAELLIKNQQLRKPD